MPDPADAKTYARPRAESARIHWPTYERQIQQESGWAHWSSPGVVKSSPSGSMGLGQLNSRFYPESDWRDPYTNISKSIEIMAGYLARFGSYRKALAAYNWGPGNVGGYTKPDGTVVPPWDGRRETISAQGAHYLDVILGQGWPEPVGNMPGSIQYEDYRDPQPAGRFSSMPKGVILHGSRSGVAGNPKDKEYLGTARYEVANTDDLGWNATIGENKVAVHLTPQEWGWNARGSSDNWLAVEIAQATVDEPITDAQVAALADWIKTRVLPAWPSLPMMFPSHAELDGTPEYGPKDGKSDVFPLGDQRMENLRTRLMKALQGGAPVPVPSPYAVGPGILAAMSAHADDPATDEIFIKAGGKDAYSEAYGTSGARYVYLPSTNRTHRYDPAA